ncbi:MAG: phosphoribosylformylglycinamidine synthase subunit PurL [Vulcanimicrobiaceae bacterium]
MPDATAGPLPASIVRAPAFAVLDVDDASLEASLREHGLALKLAEIRSVARTLDRDPTLVEAHAFDAQWSEHCSYKSSRHYLRRLPTEGPTVMQGPQEDAGIVHLGTWDGVAWGIVIAHESHNHPSQVVPFEGAATGIGGIVRDVLCMGARVIAVADPLRLGPRDDPHSRYVAQGVVDGIAAYGNAIGVPNIAGDVYFHEGFRDNALVNVVALGLVEGADIIHSKAPPDAEGWDIVLVGKATDRSGFGGAAFSSLVLDESDAEQNKSAVQVPDPFLKNVVMRASYRVFDVVRERGLTVGFKDLGAGGIMGCTAEICASGGFGAVVDLDRCPTSQADLPPAVIAVGETQERLTWVVPPSFTPELLAIYNDEFSLPLVARGAQAAVIGTVTKSKDYVLTHRGDEVMRVDVDFLTGGIRYDRPVAARPPVPGIARGDGATPLSDAVPTNKAAFADLLEAVLAHGDVCSREPIYERFDSVVRGTTSVPAGYADAGVIVPIAGAPLAAALAVDGNPRYAAVDVGRAAELAVCEAVRNVVCVGARPAGLTDCLNFGNPEVPEQMGEFVDAVDGIARAATELGVPFVSGNVSLYNTSANGSAIPASPIIACVGTLADVSRSSTPRFKRSGATIFRVGDAQNAVGGSVAALVAGVDDARLPSVDYAALRAEIALVLAAHERGLVAAAHDVSDGGMLVALAEMAFPTLATTPIGVRLHHTCRWSEDRVGHAECYFGEAGGFLIEATDARAFAALAREFDARVHEIGETIDDAAIVTYEGDGRRHDLHRLYDMWSAPLRDFYDDVAPPEPVRG